MPLFSVLLALCTSADAASVTVPAQYPTVGQAVSALASGALGGGAHTITITQDGWYPETSTVDIGGMDVTITGSGQGLTKIGAVGGGRYLFQVTGGRLVLNGLTLSGDRLLSDDSFCNYPTDRAGVHASNATVEVFDAEFRCFFKLNDILDPDGGAAITSINSDLDITGSQFEQNVSVNNGGHIYASGNTASPPNVTIAGNTLEYGITLSSGGGIALGNVVARVSDNEFDSNDSFIEGGALWVTSTISDQVEVWGNRFFQNRALGIIDYALNNDDGDPILSFDFLSGDGGGVFLDSESIDVWANLFCGNVADNGAGLHLKNPVTNSTVENNVFNDNWSFHYGGGAYLRADEDIATPEIWNNTFYGNSAGQTSPDFVPEVFVFGAGAAMMADGVVVDFHNNIVARSIFGGGVSGVHGADYIIGDPLIMQYNLWYENCENEGCDADDPSTNLHLSSDYAQHTLNFTNVQGLDPFPTYAGIGELDCYPDAFYPQWGTASIDAGDDTDPSWRDIDNSTNDVGYTGGARAPVLDRDGDGYMNTLDCDDTSAAVNPGQPEICDDFDNNCNGLVNEGFIDAWYWDGDGDGFGTDDPFAVANPVVVGCMQPAGYVAADGDCDDADASINPGAAEICDDMDNDCNGIVDDEEVLSFVQYFEDADGDNFGDSNVQVTACEQPVGFIEFGGDCDDTNDSINPAGTETCNGADDDCNGVPDDNAADAQEWFIDSDQDGYGSGIGAVSCDPPGTGSFVNQGGDCLEGDATINPGAEEICDLIDNNCDGGVDNDPTDGNTYYFDADGDGYVDEASALSTCDDGPPNGMFELSEQGFDCDDSDEFVTACASSCGCSVSASPGSSAWLLAMAGLLVMRRRRS